MAYKDWRSADLRYIRDRLRNDGIRSVAEALGASTSAVRTKVWMLVEWGWFERGILDEVSSFKKKEVKEKEVKKVKKKKVGRPVSRKKRAVRVKDVSNKPWWLADREKFESVKLGVKEIMK